MAYFHIYTYLYDTFPLLIVNLQQQEILQLAVIVLVELIVSGSHCLLLSSDGDWFCIQYWPKSKDNSRNPMNFIDTHCCVQSSSPMRSLSRQTADQRSNLKHARAAAEHTACITLEMYLMQHQASKPFITSMSPNTLTGGSATITHNTANTLLGSCTFCACVRACVCVRVGWGGKPSNSHLLHKTHLFTLRYIYFTKLSFLRDLCSSCYKHI